MINPAWDNNAYCHSRLLRALPDRCERVLDVGCGRGAFAVRLAQRSERVDAVDRSAEMIESARRIVPANVTCQLGDVAEMTLPDGAYDAITSIAALHHMSPPTVLPRRYRREMHRRTGTGPPMPGMDPALTIRQVRRQAEPALPGVTVRRLPVPRYELRWRKPDRLFDFNLVHAGITSVG